MYLFDTDSFSQYLRGDAQLTRRVTQTPNPLLFLCSITVEELLQGRLAAINKVRATPEVVRAYDFLLLTLEDLRLFTLLRFDERSESYLRALPSRVKQAGSQDWRIAAIAHTNGLTVITRNARDFSRIPDARFEDWSVD